MSDADDFFGGSGRSAKFNVQGDTITGTIVSEPTSRQQVDFKTKEPKVFRNGNKAMCLVVELQTDKREDDEDDGVRNLYINKPSNLFDAVSEALANAKAKGLTPGGKLSVTWTGLGKPFMPGAQAPRVFSATYEPGPSASEQHFAQEQPAAQTQAAAQQPQQGGLDLSNLDPATLAAIQQLQAQGQK